MRANREKERTKANTHCAVEQPAGTLQRGVVAAPLRLQQLDPRVEAGRGGLVPPPQHDHGGGVLEDPPHVVKSRHSEVTGKDK